MSDVFLLVGVLLALVAKVAHVIFKKGEIIKRDVVLIVTLIVLSISISTYLTFKDYYEENDAKVVKELSEESVSDVG